MRGPRSIGSSRLLGSALCLRLDHADHVTLGVDEQAYLDIHLGNLVRAHHPRPPEALGLSERRLDVVNRDVERDVAVVSLRGGPDAAGDSVPVDAGVLGVDLDDRVVRRTEWVAELPAEQFREVAAQLVA